MRGRTDAAAFPRAAARLMVCLLSVLAAFAALNAPGISLAATYQPDVVFKDFLITSLSEDVYEATPVYQVWTQRRVYPGRKADFRIYVGNDGDTSDSFVFEGCPSVPDFKIRYWQQEQGSRTEVTDEVVAGTFIWGPIAAGSSTGTLRASVAASRHAPRKVTCTLRVSSEADPGKIDVVRFHVRVRHRA